MFGTWGAGHGAACFTDLIRQRRPMSGHKKTRRYVTTGGRVIGVVGAYSSLKKSIVIRPAGSSFNDASLITVSGAVGVVSELPHSGQSS